MITATKSIQRIARTQIVDKIEVPSFYGEVIQYIKKSLTFPP
jgi:hypothetical protein